MQNRSHRRTLPRALAVAAAVLVGGLPAHAGGLVEHDPEAALLAASTIELGSAEELAAYLAIPEADGRSTLSSPRVVSYAGFVPATTGQSCTKDLSSAYLTTVATPTTDCCVVAPVSLPQGATVSSIVLWAHDNQADDFAITLRRKTLATTLGPNLMATVSTSGTGTGVRVFLNSSISLPVVDNRLYSYYLQSSSCLKGTAHRLYSLSIFYTP